MGFKKITEYFKRFLQKIFGLSNGVSKKEELIVKSKKIINDISATYSPKEIKRGNLSNQEIKYLIEKAEPCIDSRDFNQAINYLNQLIESAISHPYYFKRRGFCHRMIGNADKAIEDFTSAIKLDPDDGTTYWELAPCYSYKISHEGIVNENERKHLLEKSLKNYKSAVERIPTSQEAWLAIIETDLRLFEFDDAISNYGASKPYIDTKEYQLVRSWLGCLAFTLTGDSIEDEDKKPLNNPSIRLKWNHWSLRAIDLLLIELEQKSFDKEKFQKAKEIHQKFIEHFDEPPLRFEQKLNEGQR